MIKKNKYLTRRIDSLKKENNELKKENQALSYQLDINKREILLRQKTLDEKEALIDEIKESYDTTLNELRKLKSDYEKNIKTMREFKAKYENGISNLLKALRKQKINRQTTKERRS